MSLENLRKICLNLSLLIDSFILINLLRNVQIVGPLYRIDCLPISYLTRGITNWLALSEGLLPDFKVNKNHFVNFTGATFVLATHVEGSFSSTSLSGDMKIFFIANILKR